jgi:hypothetical protein
VSGPLGRLARRVPRAAKARLRRVNERVLELRYGVATSEHVYHEDLGLDTENRVWHDPSDWVAIRRALARLRVGPDDVFVDFGSGLGRALLVASTLPFRRVVGIELSAELSARARRNLVRSRIRRRADKVEVVTADALEWPIPPDLTVAYLYCPFTGDVFRRVIDKLLQSVDEHPRPLRLVYNYPFEHNQLVRNERMRVLSVAPSTWPGKASDADVIVTYLVLPSDERLAAEYSARFPRRIRGSEQWLGEYEPGFALEKPARLGGLVAERPKKD